MRFPARRIFATNNIHVAPDSANSLNTTTTTTHKHKHKKQQHLKQLTQVQSSGNSFAKAKKWFVNNLRNYCNTTSLHGFSYITTDGVSRNERYFWIFIIVIAIITSIVLVIISYLWSRNTPTVTVIETAHFPTWNIPFPAVTVCNFNKISKKKATNLIKTLKRPANMSDEELLKIFHITLYFDFAVYQEAIQLTQTEEVLRINNLTVQQLMDSLSPDCMEMITRCIWKSTTSRCDSLFQRIFTVEGVCCSFNYFGRQINNFPEKIAYQVPKRPYRVTGCGYSTGITVILNPMADDYYGTYFSSYGFRLLIHDAYNFPDENAEIKVISATRESFIRINPETTYAMEEVKSLNINLRNCFFANEHKLVAMQRYSFINCMVECRMKILFERCGCVPHNLPNNGTFPYCEVRQMKCIIELKEVFSRALPTLDETLTIERDTKRFPCDCLPDCESNYYPSEITMGRLNENMAFSNTIVRNQSEHINEQIVVHVFFSDLMSTRYRMELFQNWTAALASFGGLLGLIMGFSTVAAFEFIYFLTFRPVFNYLNDM